MREEKHFLIEWFSGQGAGGQHRNKHQNSARITHLPTGIVKCAQTRSRANSQAEAMAAIIQALDNIRCGAGADDENSKRKSQIAGGERSDRQRIWRFQHDIVTDSRTGLQLRCQEALKGRMDGLWARTFKNSAE